MITKKSAIFLGVAVILIVAGLASYLYFNRASILPNSSISVFNAQKKYRTKIDNEFFAKYLSDNRYKLNVMMVDNIGDSEGTYKIMNKGVLYAASRNRSEKNNINVDIYLTPSLIDSESSGKIATYLILSAIYSHNSDLAIKSVDNKEKEIGQAITDYEISNKTTPIQITK